MDYSCIVFDTAPTGHTLRLLQFPTTLQKGLSKVMSLKGMFGGMLNQLGALFGAGGGDNIQDQLLNRLEQLKVRPDLPGLGSSHVQEISLTVEDMCHNIGACHHAVLLNACMSSPCIVECMHVKQYDGV